jgi:hypothetical protein
MKQKRLLKYRKWYLTRQYLRLLNLLRGTCHVIVVLPMSGKGDEKAFKHIGRLIHKGYLVQII